MLERRQDGEWTEISAETSKSFERVRAEASRGLMQGFAGIFTHHRWEGHVCHISGMGAEGIVTFKEGRPVATIVCRVRCSSFPALLFKRKIVADVEALTVDVSGAIDPGNHNVFIAHGHDHVARSQLERLLRALSLEPVILVDKDDLGLTVIEKFEYYAASCSFAFVLLTPDDFASASPDEPRQQRARQNVIMELGWFMAKLGRERVVILHKGAVEIPSDISGVIDLQFQDQVEEVEGRIRQRLRGVGLLDS